MPHAYMSHSMLRKAVFVSIGFLVFSFPGIGQAADEFCLTIPEVLDAPNEAQTRLTGVSVQLLVEQSGNSPSRGTMFLECSPDLTRDQGPLIELEIEIAELEAILAATIAAYEAQADSLRDEIERLRRNAHRTWQASPKCDEENLFLRVKIAEMAAVHEAEKAAWAEITNQYACPEAASTALCECR